VFSVWAADIKKARQLITALPEGTTRDFLLKLINNKLKVRELVTYEEYDRRYIDGAKIGFLLDEVLSLLTKCKDFPDNIEDYVRGLFGEIKKTVNAGRK